MTKSFLKAEIKSSTIKNARLADIIINAGQEI